MPSARWWSVWWCLVLSSGLCLSVIPEGDVVSSRTLSGEAAGGAADSSGAGASITCPRSCRCGSRRLRRDVVCEAGEGDVQPPTTLPQDTEFLVLEGYASVPTQLLAKMPRLRHLRVGLGGRLQRLELPELPLLEELDVSRSGVLALSPNLGVKTPALRHLNASHNRLTEVNGSALHGLVHLQVLDLRGNPMHALAREALGGLGMLTYLDISSSQVRTLHHQWMRDAPGLRHLNISRARLTELPRLHGKDLAVMDASHNFLTELPEALLVSSAGLQELYLHHNPLAHVHLPALQEASALRVLDLSHTAIVNVDEFVFSQMPRLRHLSLEHCPDLHRVEHGAFSGLHSLQVLVLSHSPHLREVEEVAFAGLPTLRTLDLRRSGLTVLPLSVRLIANHSTVLLAGTRLRCDCHHHWLPSLLSKEDISSWSGVEPLECTDGTARYGHQLAMHVRVLGCQAPTVIRAAPTPEEEADVAPLPGGTWQRVKAGQSAALECNVTGHPHPAILWLSATNQVFRHNTTSSSSSLEKEEEWLSYHLQGVEAVALTSDPHIEVLASGHLLIRDVTREDAGRYKCFAYNAVGNTSRVFFLGLDDQPLRDLYTESLLFGFACAALFLLITLIVQLINYLMDRLGWSCCWSCCCCKDRLSPKARQIKKLLESVESYKTQQLERLRDNYNAQVVSIKDSCYLQMERIRESYGGQTKHLRDLRDYSTQGLTTVKDQYLDQLNNIRDYSVSQMSRVRENYVFQRHRIRKFSAHQLLRLRETYKYQQKTLNKILENLPDLYLQNCRTGGCQRTDSILFDDALNGIDAYYKVDFFDTQSHGSDYYTPASTLTRSFRSKEKRHSRNSSNTSGDFVEAQPWIRRDSLSVSSTSPAHGGGGLQLPPAAANTRSSHHSRSLSVTTPTAFVPEPVRVHKRSLSATHPYHRVAPAPETRGVPARITLCEEASDYDLATPPTSPISLPTTPIVRQRPTIEEEEPPIAQRGCKENASRQEDQKDDQDQLLVAVAPDSAGKAPSTAYETSL